MNASTGRTLWTIVVCTLCTLHVGVMNVSAAEPIRINGSGSGLFMMTPLIKAYTKAHPDVRITMEKPLGSSGAIKALLGGALDIAVSSKVLKPEELSMGAVSREYGRTPLAFVTGKKGGKTDITTKELEDIYSGRLKTWPDGVPIRLILRPDSDIDTKILEGLSPEMGKAVKIAHSQKGMAVAITDPESDDAVAKTQGSLGAAALPAILADKAPLSVLALNGVKPTVATLANGTYPLAKDIRFVTTKNTPPEAVKFLEFIYSPQGRAIAGNAGVLVPVAGK
jgi:phosphate transport system substrate-binding protein